MYAHGYSHIELIAMSDYHRLQLLWAFGYFFRVTCDGIAWTTP
jgi:hypothetical protein